MNKFINRFLLALFTIAFATVAAMGQANSAVRKPVELKLDHEKLGKTPTIEVLFNGKMRSFYFDTGGGISAISPALAKEIGCNPVGEYTAYNAGGMKFKVKRCEDVEFNLNGYTVKRDVTVYDPMAFFPNAKGQVDGAIALDLFDNQYITFDLAGNQLWVESNKSAKKRIKTMSPLTSRLSRESSGATLDVFFAAQSPNGKIWMLVDTGNTNKMLFTPSAQKQLGINFDSPTGEKIIKPIKLNLLGLGEIEMDSREREMIYDGMLNYDLLAKMIFTTDLGSGKTWAKLN